MSLLDRYSYDLPSELIAKEPATPRDSARLLVYDTSEDEVVYTSFKQIGEHLPKKSLLVFNDTKVVPARLPAVLSGGEQIELFLLLDEGVHEGGIVHGLVSRYVPVGEVLKVGTAEFEVVENHEKWMRLKTTLPLASLLRLLEDTGTTPIPPYIKDSPLTEVMLRKEYQSVLAQKEASVAAPTASLHFTSDLLEQLEQQEHAVELLTLHVGLGTFAPVLPEQIAQGKLHSERYEIGKSLARSLREAKASGRNSIAVGTTVVRALESAKADIMNGSSSSGTTELFIYPPYEFTFPDALITNFHVPRSSLMCMVDAFLQHKKARRGLLDIYASAIAEKFRFYSFGDGMLIK